MTLSPEVSANAVIFLIEIGRWVRDELKETWKVRRGKQITDLTRPDAVRLSFPKLLESATEKVGQEEVERVLRQLNQKKILLDQWEQTLNLNEQQVSEGTMTRAQATLQAQSIHARHKQTIEEIVDLLKRLDIEIVKVAVN